MAQHILKESLPKSSSDLDSAFLDNCLSSIARDGWPLLNGDDLPPYWSDLVQDNSTDVSLLDSLDDTFSDIGDLLDEDDTISDISSLQCHSPTLLDSPFSGFWPKADPEWIVYERESPEPAPSFDTAQQSPIGDNFTTESQSPSRLNTSLDLYDINHSTIITDEHKKQQQIQKNAQICELLSPIRKYQVKFLINNNLFNKVYLKL